MKRLALRFLFFLEQPNISLSFCRRSSQMVSKCLYVLGDDIELNGPALFATTKSYEGTEFAF